MTASNTYLWIAVEKQTLKYFQFSASLLHMDQVWELGLIICASHFLYSDIWFRAKYRLYTELSGIDRWRWRRWMQESEGPPYRQVEFECMSDNPSSRYGKRDNVTNAIVHCSSDSARFFRWNECTVASEFSVCVFL